MDTQIDLISYNMDEIQIGRAENPSTLDHQMISEYSDPSSDFKKQLITNLATSFRCYWGLA